MQPEDASLVNGPRGLGRGILYMFPEPGLRKLTSACDTYELRMLCLLAELSLDDVSRLEALPLQCSGSGADSTLL